MCIFCGGQGGGIGEFLISLGLPFLALYFSKIKNSLVKIKNKIIQRDSGAEKILDEANNCRCCGEPLRDCREIFTQSIDPENLELLELKSQDNGPAEISIETPKLNNKIKIERKEELKGVRGWLLLLCLILTIFIPTSYLYEANCILDLFNSTRNKILLLLFKQSLIFNIVFFVSMVFLAIFSFYAGLKLWEVRQKAVRTAKVFLISQLSLTFIIVVSQPFMTSPLGGNENIFGDMMKRLIPSLFHFSLWYL